MIVADGKKMIKLRNPWGKGEWTGDWSDASSLWTTRMRNLCDFSAKDVNDDGIFWMEWSDFCDEFEDIYICKKLPEGSDWNVV